MKLKPVASLSPKTENHRLATLSVELSIAMAEILQEDYGWSQIDSTVFVDKVLIRAKKNRKENLRVSSALDSRRS